MIRLVLLLTLTTFLSEARAEWHILIPEPGVTVAVLGEIEVGDEKVPKADLYVLASPGGVIGVAMEIAEKLKGKTVKYTVAFSAAAFIADEIAAVPGGPTAIKGYHWATYVGEPDPKAELGTQLANQVVLTSITRFYKPRYAACIIGLMCDLPDGWFVIETFNKERPERLTPVQVENHPLVIQAAKLFW